MINKVNDDTAVVVLLRVDACVLRVMRCGAACCCVAVFLVFCINVLLLLEYIPF